MSLADYTVSNPVVLNFNSKDRVSGRNSNFQSAPVDLGNNTFDSVALVQCSIPKSFYNMPSGYNTFRLTEFDGVSSSSVTITIPPGNYTRINLQSVLSTVLTNASPDGLTYNVTYPPSTSADTFHYTINVNASDIYTISLTFFENSPFRQLGFDVGTYTFSEVSLVLQQLESVNAINLAYILRAFIKSNIVSNATDGILEELLQFGSFPSSSVMSFQQVSFDLNSRVFNPDNKNSWTFALVDSFSNEIDLNNVPWAFSLVLWQRNATHEIHKKDLLITNEERLFKIQQEQERLKQELATLK
jgi:hypothetical protein